MVPTLPPFELNKYRLIYLEQTRSLTCLTVKGDPAFRQTEELAEYLMESWKADSIQVSDILLRIILHTERANTRAERPPMKFVLSGKGYTLLVEQTKWRLADQYTFRQEIFDPHHRNPNHDGGKEGDELRMADVTMWPLKYTVTYAPEEVARE